MPDLLIQIFLDERGWLWNEADRAQGQIVGNTAQLEQKTDYFGSLYCYTPPNDDYFFFVDFSKNIRLQTYNIPSSQLNTATTFRTSLQTWFLRNNTAAVNILSDPTEILFQHVNVTKITFEMLNYRFMRVDPSNQLNRPFQTLCPFNRWLFLQVISTPTFMTVQIFESDGNQLITQTITHSSSLISSSRIVNMGQNFNGNIYGLKYYKNERPPTSGVHRFNYGFEQSADALIYFMFTQQGMSQQGQFQNLAINSRTQSLSTVNSLIVTTKRYFKQLNSTSIIGSINEPLRFDGYTCMDEREKLFMVNSSSYASTTITLNQTLNNFTVELWVRTTRNNIGTTYFLALQEQSRNKVLSIVIMQEQNNLRCYPFMQTRPDKVDYLDYRTDEQTWFHISCIYNQITRVAQGTLYYKTVDQVYFSDIAPASALNLSVQTYNLFINSNPLTLRDGVDRSYYADVRFWENARTQWQIRNQRFMQLDVEASRPQLYSYMKFLYGSTNGIDFEIDFAKTSTFQQITLSNTKWQTLNDLLICPLAMYRGSLNDNKCYREGILSLELSIFKSVDQNYVVTPIFSSFRNSYLRDEQSEIFNFLWTLTKVETGNQTNSNIFPVLFSRQRTNQALVFRFDDVVDRPGRYIMNLQVNDKQNFQQSRNQEVNLRTIRCANIFDSETKLSYVDKDLEQTRTAEDSVFTYDFTDCQDYEFDQSAMTFEIDIAGISLSTSDHNRNAKTFTLRRTIQSNIPSNDKFFIRMKGVWRNVRNRNDVIEYHLIYSCRYIPKLIITLTPNLKIVSRGQTLVIDLTGKFSNLNSASAGRNYTIQWVCPGQLNTFCLNQRGTTLRLNYDQVVNSRVQLFKEQVISVKATTNFIQGDGQRFTQENVLITWINLLPQANISVITQSIGQNSVIAFQFNSLSLTDDQISLKWRINPTLSKSCFINSDNRKQFVVNQSCIQEGRSYLVNSDLYYRNHSQVIIASSLQYQSPNQPSGGRVQCGPQSGKAYIDTINCTTSGWKSSNGELLYQFFAINQQGVEISISSLSSLTTIQSRLMPTSRIVVKVIDTMNQQSEAIQSVNYDFQYSEQISNIISNQIQRAQSLQQTNPIQAIQGFTWAASALINSDSRMNRSISLEFRRKIPEILNLEVSLLNTKTSLDIQSFVMQSFEIALILSNRNLSFDAISLNSLQQALVALRKYQSAIDTLMLDPNFQSIYLQSQINILLQLKTQQDLGAITKFTNDRVLSNITSQLRIILADFEQSMSRILLEGQRVQFSNNAFNISIQKYSRIANQMEDFLDKSNPKLDFLFPLSAALQPSDRQTFTTINFFISPFIGSSFYNQTTLIDYAVYFSYRNDKGAYLTTDNVLGDISMVFDYDFPTQIGLQNSTTCGYIGSEDLQWENSSCSTQFDTVKKQITCTCKHMSYYAIIDDYLKRSSAPIQNLFFNNWLSIIPFGYMLLLFISGSIYCYSKDNKDFRELSETDDSQGTKLTSQGSITIGALAFKKKVFYMSMSDEFLCGNYVYLCMKMLHPLFQLRNYFDAELPRYYKFMLLYTRVMIILGASFYFLRSEEDIIDMFTETDDLIIKIIIVAAISVGGGLILTPFPSFIYCCCRSKYKLVKPQKEADSSEKEQKQKENRQDQDTNEREKQHQNIIIDTNLPLKLLFMLNAQRCDTIISEYQQNFSFARGNLGDIGKKLQEVEVLQLHEDKPEKDFDHAQFSNNNITERKLKDETVITQEHQTFRNQIADQIKSDGNLSPFEEPEMIQSNFKTRGIKEKQSEATPDKKRVFIPHKDKALDHQEVEFEIKDGPKSNSKVQQLLHEGGEEEEEERKSPQKTQQTLGNTQRTSRTLNTATKFQGEEELNERSKSDIMMESYMGSLESQFFQDEQKELVEVKNIVGRSFANIFFLIFNLAILAGIFYFYVTEEYYLDEDLYVWILVFFAAQFIGLFLIDSLIILLVSCSVATCCRRRKICLAKFYREALYIYEDYKYVVDYSDTKIN